MNRITLEEALRQKVLGSGLSVNGLAKAAGVPQSVLQPFVRSRQGINLRTADKLATYFGMKLVEVPRKDRGR